MELTPGRRVFIVFPDYTGELNVLPGMVHAEPNGDTVLVRLSVDLLDMPEEFREEYVKGSSDAITPVPVSACHLTEEEAKSALEAELDDEDDEEE